MTTVDVGEPVTPVVVAEASPGAGTIIGVRGTSTVIPERSRARLPNIGRVRVVVT
jgi:hypothetical protein